MVDAETQQLFERVNDGRKFKVGIVPLEILDLLEKNARFMTNEQFTNLVRNIENDGGLSSVPFCVKTGDRFRVLSGNHRVMAARHAGLTEILILYSEEALTREQEVARILSHNSISGQDDLQTLKELYEEIHDVNLKYYSGLDDITLDKMDKLAMPPLSEIPLEFRQVTFVFLPEEADRLEAVANEVMDTIRGDDIYLSRFSDFDRFMDTLDCVKKVTGVKNVATVIMLMLNVVEKHMDELPGYLATPVDQESGSSV